MDDLNTFEVETKCETKEVPMPPGLRDIMQDIGREVLRAQPCDIPLFLANYLTDLLVNRENTKIAKITLNTIFDLAVSVAEILQILNLSYKLAEELGVFIMELYRGYLNAIDKALKSTSYTSNDRIRVVECVISQYRLMGPLRHLFNFNMTQAMTALRLIESRFRMFYNREQCYLRDIQNLTDEIWHSAVIHTFEFYKKQVLNDQGDLVLEGTFEFHDKHHRGYKTRRELPRFAKTGVKEDCERAARIIQRSYRRFRDYTNKEINHATKFIVTCFKERMKRIRDERAKKYEAVSLDSILF